MRWSDVIDLSTVTTTYDDYGSPVDTEVWNTVFANKKSIRQSEFYQAHAVGLKPEIIFEIREVEYTNANKARYGGVDGVVYHIIRTFSKNGEVLELVCSRSPLER